MTNDNESQWYTGANQPVQHSPAGRDSGNNEGYDNEYSPIGTEDDEELIPLLYSLWLQSVNSNH